MLHYNFPPFSMGEVKPLRGAGRREIGHGDLAERALPRCCPTDEDFPYTIRIVSEILESNGSSSMATVCGGSLSLMDAGVPIKAPVAGIAMGLIKEGDGVAVLSDILGDEDHLGDMDFKVAGTARASPPLQMDIKIEGLTREILETALEQATRRPPPHPRQDGRGARAPARRAVAYAPRIVTMQIKPDRIRDIIGPGGKMIRAIRSRPASRSTSRTTASVTSPRPTAALAKQAIDIIKGLTHGARGRQDLHRHGEADRRVRRVRRDLAGHRRPGPHQRAREKRVRAVTDVSRRATRCW